MAERLRKEVLPPPWSYGVTKDGRIFFINDQTRITTWIHPVRGVPIGTGFTNREDLPPGWQEGITPEGAVFFIDHNEEQTSFRHPFTGRTEVESNDLLLVEPETHTSTSADPTMSAQPSSQLHVNVSAKVASSPSFRPSLSNQNSSSSTMSPSSPSVDKANFKSKRIPKADTPSAKRSQNSTIVMEGWLYKQDSGGLKLWKRRWCVISDFCLFYYRGADEVNKAGSIMLPSYKVLPVSPSDKINRKYAFKCQHENMRTYYFAAENQGQMSRWLSTFQMASMVRIDKTIGSPHNGDFRIIPDEDDAGFSEYRSLRKKTPATSRSSTLQSSAPNGKSNLQRQQPHQQNGTQHPLEFDDPRYATPQQPQGRPDSISLKDSKKEPQHTDTENGYSSISGRDKNRKLRKAPSPAKRKLYEDYSSPDEGAGSRYDPNLDPFREEDPSQDSVDSYATPSDDEVFNKSKTPTSRKDFQFQKNETVAKTSAQEEHAGYVTRKADNSRGHRLVDDYEDTTGSQPDWRKGAGRHGDYFEMQNLHKGIDVDQQWSTGSESDSETESYSDNEDEVQEFPNYSPPQEMPSSPQDIPPSSLKNVPQSHLKSPPHSPGHYPASYNTLPRQKSSRSSNTSKEDGHRSPRSPSSERENAVRPLSLHIPRKQSPGSVEGRRRLGSDPHHPFYQPPRQSSPDTQSYARSAQDLRSSASPPSSQRVSSPSSASSSSRSDRPAHRRDNRFQGPDKPPRDQSEAVFHFPRDSHPKEQTSPEQRSFLQSPLVQPSQPITPEQRININSPMTFDGKPQWPQKKQKQSRQQSPQSSKDDGADRIVPRTQEPVQASAPAWEKSPLVSSHQNGASSGDRPPSTNGAPDRSASKDKLSASITDQMDVAPTRGKMSRPSPNLRKRDTLERQEIETGDQFPTLDNEAMKLGAQPTSRFRKWQQKIQPYITLSTGIRLRLSIAGDELLGKSHEELVLLLIQLRRDQANLQCWLEMLDDELALLQDPDTLQGSPSRMRHKTNEHLRLSNGDLTEDQQYYKELVKERDEVYTEVEISRPLINLVDNLVRMGSLYGGQNELIAQEFYKDKVGNNADFPPAKKLIEFSRRREEELLKRDLEEEWNQVQTAEDRQLEEKLQQLHKQDRRLQEVSTRVSVLKEEKDMIELSTERLQREMRKSWEDPDRMASLKGQQRDLKKELVKVRSQLAKRTKELEEITAENSKIEYEVAVLKSKLQNKKQTALDPAMAGSDTTKQKLQMEREVSRVQSLMVTLDQQRELLKSQMQGIRKNGEVPLDKGSQDKLDTLPEEFGQYFCTDLDTMEVTDMSPSYHRSRANSQNKATHSQDFAPVSRKPILPSGQEAYSRDAISERLNVAPPRGQDWRGSGSDVRGRPSSASKERKKSLPHDARRNNPYEGRSPRSQDNYQHSTIQPRQANETLASPLPMGPSQHNHSRDSRPSSTQQRHTMDPKHSRSQQTPPQHTPAEQRRRDYQSGRANFVHKQGDSLPYDQGNTIIHNQGGTFPREHREVALNTSNKYSSPQNLTYRHTAQLDKNRQQEYNPEEGNVSSDRPNTHSSSSMPRDRTGKPRHSDSFNRHPTHSTPAQKSSTLPNRKPYIMTDLDTKQSQQILPEMYERDPPSGSSSSQKSGELADELLVSPEICSEESQGNSSHAELYSTLHGDFKSKDYDSQPSHERYDKPSYKMHSQSLPYPQSHPRLSSNKPYLVTNLDTRESQNITEIDLETFNGTRLRSNSENKQAPPPQHRSDSLRRVKEMKDQISPFQLHQDYSQQSNHDQSPPDLLNSPIQDGVYFATPSPRHSMAEDEVDACRKHPVDGWTQSNHSVGQQPNSTKRLNANNSHSESVPNRKERPDGKRAVRLTNDIGIDDIERVLKVQEYDENEIDMDNVRGSKIVGADDNSFEIDESSVGGLFGMPAMIVIPERYNPLEDSSEDETGLSPEELVQRERRVENIQKMLSSHSMPEWANTGHDENQDDCLKRRVAEEKIVRQEVLAKRRELALEIKQQTRVIAAQSMRRVGAGHEP